MRYLIFFCYFSFLVQADKDSLKSLNQTSFLIEKEKEFELLFEEKKIKPYYKVEIVVKDIEAIPWGMAFLNERELIWTERKGLVKKIDVSTGKITVIKVVFKNLYHKGLGGLMDVALHPGFKENSKIYFTYSFKSQKKRTTALARGQLIGSKIINLKRIFTAKDLHKVGCNFGSRLAFDKKGFLFMTVGYGESRDSAQDLSSHMGKLLRLDENGKAASGNPFIKNKKARPEIYSYGHRNPQGLFIDSKNKQIYMSEHGPWGGG